MPDKIHVCWRIPCFIYVLVSTLSSCVVGSRLSMSETSLFLSDDPSDDFQYDNDYRIILRHGKDIINNTLTPNGRYKEITLTLYAFGQIFELDLKLNTFLFAAGYRERLVRRSGDTYRKVNHTESHCYYIGKVKDKTYSTAAVSTCNGIVGHFTIANTSYHIEPEGEQQHPHGRTHRVYRSRADAKTKFKCGTNDGSFASLVNHETFRRRMRRSFIWSQDLDKENKIVELYLANNAANSPISGITGYNAFERTKNIANIASSLWQSLGINLVLVGLEVWKDDMIGVNNSDSIGTLYKWYKYRGDVILPIVPHDSAVLIIGESFIGGVIGRAVMGYMCSYKYSGAVVSDIYYGVSAAGNTVAHEIGHTFGLAHDNNFSSCECDDPSGACIMNAYTNLGNPASKWSSCSLNTLKQKLSEGIDACLYNVPRIALAPSSLCGNGIVEDGEQCDCGRAPIEQCNSACCNSTTCQLTAKASCAYGRCCDVPKCKIFPQGQVCRPKKEKSTDCDSALIPLLCVHG